MLGRLHKFAQLHGDDRTLLLRAFLVVAAVRVGLWSLPFRLLQKLASRASGRSALRQRNNARSIAMLTGAVEAAARPIPAATCLTQALAAQFLLAQNGHASTLRIGVLTAGGQFKAHAWLEHAGRIVIGDVAGIGEFKSLPLPGR
jgi:hypothetical protein